MRNSLLVSGLVMLVLTGATGKPGDGMRLAALKRLGEIDERYQSYNIEMVEVTGGRFWAPYGGPAGEIYRQRPPLDLNDPRLRNLARNLAPAYMRVSGTWANNTYVPRSGEQTTAPPQGFSQVLTRAQWHGVVDFSRSVNAPIVTSFAASAGTRGPDGAWQAGQAQRLVDMTNGFGGTLAAAEFFNEPNIPSAAPGMPKGYNAARYGADFRIFRDWARKAAPGMKILGPGGLGEGGMIGNIPANSVETGVTSADMMKANPGSVDAVSYHFYGAVSQRCAGMKLATATEAEALKPEWLDRTLRDYAFYSALRDRYEPGKPMWNTETAQAACGGSPWASTFLDTFRYLNQLGALAQKGVQVVMHNTLVASDYALVDRDTMMPRPNYWAAVLWRRLMGKVVLTSPASPSPQLRLYAQCLRGEGRNRIGGGVVLLALNLGGTAQNLDYGGKGRAWVMTGRPIGTRSVLINGVTPAVGANGVIQGLKGIAVKGHLSVPGQAIAFIAVPDADNKACM